MQPPHPLDELRDPQTAPQRLSELAQAHPELHPQIAAHPNAYPGLVEWMAQVARPGGQPAGQAGAQAGWPARGQGVNPGAGAHGGQAQGTAPDARTAQFSNRGPGHVGGPGAQPAAPHAAAAPKPGGRPKWLIPVIAGGVALVLVAVAAVIAIPMLLQAMRPGSAVTVANWESRPSTEAWSVWGPSGMSEGSAAYFQSGLTVAQDEAIVAWSVTEAPGSGTVGSVLWASRVNTRTGEEQWSVELPEFGGAQAPYNFDYWSSTIDQVGLDRIVMLATPRNGGDMVPVSLNLETGEYLVGQDLRFVGMPDRLGGDVIAVHTTQSFVGRFDPATFEPVWSVPQSLDTTGGARAVANTLLLDGRAFDLADGSERDWKPETGAEYGAVGNHLLTSRGQGSGTLLTAVDESTGEARWSLTLAPGEFGVPLRGEDKMMLLSESTGAARLLDIASGEVKWETTYDGSEPYFSFARSANVVLLSSRVNSATATAYDVDSGEVRFDAMIRGGDQSLWVTESTSSTLYLTDSRGGVLQAIDGTSGQVRWTLDNPHENWYTFAVLGGNIIAHYPCCLGSGQGGGDPAPLIGIG